MSRHRKVISVGTGRALIDERRRRARRCPEGMRYSTELKRCVEKRKTKLKSRFEKISFPVRPSRLSEKAILEDHDAIHAAWNRTDGSEQIRISGVVRTSEEIAKAHALLVDEMKKRVIEHDFTAGTLDQKSLQFEIEKKSDETPEELNKADHEGKVIDRSNVTVLNRSAGFSYQLKDGLLFAFPDPIERPKPPGKIIVLLERQRAVSEAMNKAPEGAIGAMVVESIDAGGREFAQIARDFQGRRIFVLEKNGDRLAEVEILLALIDNEGSKKKSEEEVKTEHFKKLLDQFMKGETSLSPIFWDMTPERHRFWNATNSAVRFKKQDDLIGALKAGDLVLNVQNMAFDEIRKQESLTRFSLQEETLDDVSVLDKRWLLRLDLGEKTLRTFTISTDPLENNVVEAILSRESDKSKIALDEGDIKLIDSGDLIVIKDEKDKLEVSFEGEKLKGEFVFNVISAGGNQFMISPSIIPKPGNV